jgi:glutamate racemase
MSIETTSTDMGPVPPDPAVKAPTVGIFDSGIGGFTVAEAILKRRPDLNLVYFGDTLNMPYGGRSLTQLARFARSSIEFLLEQGMDILAVGCNASNSALGQGELKSFGVPVYDLVTSTVEWLRGSAEKPEAIGLIATRAAIGSGYWERKLREAAPSTRIVPVATPEFVPLVEAGEQDEQANRDAVQKYLQPLLNQGVTTILHGCTHYPILQPLMEQLSTEFSFIDPAVCLAEKLVASLPPRLESAPLGRLRLFSSLPGPAFHTMSARVFGPSARDNTLMYIVNPYED